MKTIFKSIFYLLISVVVVSCSEKEAVQPHAAITIDKNTYDINESMEIRFVGSADNVVIYPGDSGQDYELREQSNTGLVVNKGLLTYSYQYPGTYKVVCVATNYTDEGKSIKRDTCSMYVKVIDDVTEIEQLSANQVLYDEVFAEKVSDSEWLMKLPRRIKYRTSTPSVSLSQRLKFYIASDSSKITIDGAAYNSTTRYDLSNTLDIQVTSHEGSVANYKLYTLNYGTFNTFSVLGKTGSIVYTEYDYSYYEMAITVPSGTDLTTLVPEFTTRADNEVAYIDGVEQVSGSSVVDFSEPVIYKFITTHPENSAVKAESTFVITVTTE